MIPPKHASSHRGSNRLGYARIEIENDGLLGLAYSRGGLSFFEAPSPNPLNVRALVVRRGVVLERQGQRSDSWIGRARAIAFGKLYKGMMQPDRQRARLRRYAAD